MIRHLKTLREGSTLTRGSHGSYPASHSEQPAARSPIFLILCVINVQLVKMWEEQSFISTGVFSPVSETRTNMLFQPVVQVRFCPADFTPQVPGHAVASPFAPGSNAELTKYCNDRAQPASMSQSTEINAQCI